MRLDVDQPSAFERVAPGIPYHTVSERGDGAGQYRLTISGTALENNQPVSTPVEFFHQQHTQ